MRSPRLYADHNATSPLRPEARAAMIAAMDLGGNASSVHAEGRLAKTTLESAREAVASALTCTAQAVTFVSGATEGLHLAMESAAALGFGPVFVSAAEHDAIWAYAPALFRNFIAVPIDAGARIDVAGFEVLLSSAGGRPLLIAQGANNETGALQPIDRLSTVVRAAGGALLCDATQMLAKVKASAFAGVADWLVVSSHKIGGPLGMGAVVTGPAVSLVNRRAGGGQERGARSGTQNVPSAAGFAAAAAVSANDDAVIAWQALVGAERNAFEAIVAAALPDACVIGADGARLANTSCVALPAWSAERQVIGLDLAGVAVSAGAACSSGKVKASRVLSAAGWDDAIAGCAIRVSFGWTTQAGDGERLANAYIKCARARRPVAKET